MQENKTDQDLQFDKAEFETASAPATCAVCAVNLTDSYFTANTQSVCPKCADDIRNSLTRTSTVGDVVKSILFGIGAGIVGSLIYYAVLRFTGYEIGLIAILVGYLVGRAVMVGSDHRGGFKYRVIAVLITYIAIVSTYVPLVFAEIKKQEIASTATQNSANSGQQKTDASTAPVISAENSEKPDVKKNQGENNQADKAIPQLPGKMNFGAAILALLTFAGYMLILPFLAGASNIIGLIIIGFALYEAARRAQKPKVNIEGPFEIKKSGAVANA